MTCPSGKLAYRNGFEAARALRGFVSRKGPAPTLEPYLCPDCGAWHLGRSTRRDRRGKGGRFRW